MRREIVEPSPELRAELQRELTKLEAQLTQADGRRERRLLQREVRRVERGLKRLDWPYVMWSAESDSLIDSGSHSPGEERAEE